MAMTIAVAIGVSLGVAAAAHPRRAPDRAASAFALIGISVPDFWFGILFILLFSSTLHWFSAGGFPGWSDPAAALKSLLLPAVALALPQAAVLTRVTRSAVLDVTGEDFIRTARAKGLTGSQVLWRHAVRNSLVPIVTIIGLQFSFLIAGAVLVENVFNLPGIGRLAFQSLAQRDLIVIRNVAMFFAGLVILVNFLVDLAYLWLDPRLRTVR
jgi:peptide/nickel transport system permease protein